MISVVVPVYNVEKYLKKCIDSVLKQSFKDFELILVDDGSTDNSGAICDEYADDENIKVVHKENGGLADARNVGIDNSTGDYITFLDSDDFIKKDYLSILYNIAIKTKTDVVISKFINFYEGREPNENGDEDYKFSVVSKEECYRKMLLQEDIDVSATAKMYAKRVFDNIRFVKGQLYEDINIVDQVIEKANGIAITDYAGYCYLQRKGSIMYGNFNESRMSLLQATDRLLQLMKSKYPHNIEAAIYRDIYCSFHLLGRSVMDDDYKEISNQLRKRILSQKKFIFKSRFCQKKEKLATLVLMFGLPVYKLIWKNYKRDI